MKPYAIFRGRPEQVFIKYFRKRLQIPIEGLRGHLKMSYEGALNREGRHCHECRPQYRAKTEVARVGAYTGGQRVPPNTSGCPHEEQKVRPSRLGAHTGDRMPPRMNRRQHGRQNVPPRAGWHPHGRQNVPPRAGGRPPTLRVLYQQWNVLPQLGRPTLPLHGRTIN